MLVRLRAIAIDAVGARRAPRSAGSTGGGIDDAGAPMGGVHDPGEASPGRYLPRPMTQMVADLLSLLPPPPDVPTCRACTAASTLWSRR